MRIALVIERFGAGRGGAENAAWEVARRLAQGGDEVHVFARELPDAASPDEAGALRCRPHRLRVPRFWQPLRVLAFSRASARAAPRASFDVVHSFSRTRHQDLFRAGGGSHADYMRRRYGRAGARWRRFSPRHATLLAIERAVFHDATQLVQCNSTLVRSELQARYGIPDARLVVIPNGVDLERFHPRKRSEVRTRLRRRELGVGEEPVWLFVGSGFPRKGLDVALRALARADRKDARLWVAGADSWQPWQRMARSLGLEGRVRFLGPRCDPEDLYAAADALLLPTRYDAFANACLEAAASGIPVVTSAANGAAHELRGEGILVVEDPEDVEGFARAIAELADSSERAWRGREARRTAERFGWETHLARLRELYCEIRARKAAAAARG